MKFAICDDEKEIRNDISKKIKLLYNKSSIAVFENAEGLLNCKEWADIIFLDIGLPDGNGMELAPKGRHGRRPTQRNRRNRSRAFYR